MAPARALTGSGATLVQQLKAEQPLLIHHFECERMRRAEAHFFSFSVLLPGWHHVCWDERAVTQIIALALPQVFSTRFRLVNMDNRIRFYKLVVLATLGGIVADRSLIGVTALAPLAESAMFIASASREAPALELLGSRPALEPLARLVGMTNRADAEVDVARAVGQILLADAVRHSSIPGVLVLGTSTPPSATKAATPGLRSGKTNAAPVVPASAEQVRQAERCVAAAKAGGEVSLADGELSAAQQEAAARCFSAIAQHQRILALSTSVGSTAAADSGIDAFVATSRWIHRATRARERLVGALQRLQRDVDGTSTAASVSAAASAAIDVGRWSRLRAAVGGQRCRPPRRADVDRICLLMVDNRPMTRSEERACRSGEWHDLTTFANFAYAADHNYTFLRAQYTPELLQGRSYMWSKVMALWHVARTRPDCSQLVFVDTDAYFSPSAPKLEQLFRRVGLRGVGGGGKLFVFPREPAGHNTAKDFRGNDVDNTHMSTGLVAVANTPKARAMLLEWWQVPQRHRNLSRYTYQWAHEQRSWDSYMRPKYASLWAEVPERADQPPVLNTPTGSMLRHQWWKAQPVWKEQIRRQAKQLLRQGKLRHTMCSYGSLVKLADGGMPGSSSRGERKAAAVADPKVSARPECEQFKLLPGFHLADSSTCPAPALVSKGCTVPGVPSVAMCCEYCAQCHGCNAFTYWPDAQECVFAHTATDTPSVRFRKSAEKWVGVARGAPDALWDFVAHQQAAHARESSKHLDGAVIVTSFFRAP